MKNASRANVLGASAVAKELGKRFKVAKTAASSPDEEDTNRPESKEKGEKKK